MARWEKVREGVEDQDKDDDDGDGDGDIASRMPRVSLRSLASNRLIGRRASLGQLPRQLGP